MANNQQVTFNLGINTKADLDGLNQVKRMLQDVKTYASDISISGLSVNQINEVTNAASKLEHALTAAYNPKLNTISINKFNKALQKSNISLSEIQAKMSMTGTTGQQAFLKATSQLMHLNNTLIKTDGWLDRMAKSFGNVVRYQAMNAVLNKITSSISQANGYVKSLDNSLNNIQIVTEKNVAGMRQFAKEANNAAKSLGATTTDYTDASLIYYQQGLTDSEVADRTNTTMKMANVLGETASDVSDYMTAIWNNFDDGSNSLEYYGDVIAKLGAETAASAEEIATGMGKFASVADTVGLSYEYASASLATVVAATRQSADSVGTSFRTIFARLQGLKLGETLEDGTSLNKYSEALDAVGVDIKEQNGQLRDMDEILYDLGEKWKNLSKDQQVALAQTVAGTRQYAQLVALMDNWDDVLTNVEKANNATGTLEQKNAIYLDSVKAHINSAKAEWEDFFDSLISSDTVKGFADAGANLAKVFKTFTDAIGGLGPILSSLGSTGLIVFNNQLSTGLSNIIGRIQEARSVTKTFNENLFEIQSMFSNSSWVNSSSGKSSDAMRDSLQTMVSHYSQLAQYRRFMSEDDKKRVESIILEDEKIGEQRIELEETQNSWEKIAKSTGLVSTDIEKVKGNTEQLGTAAANLKQLVEAGDVRTMSINDLDALKQQLSQAVQAAGGDANTFENMWQQAIEGPRKALDAAKSSVAQYTQDIDDLNQHLKQLKSDAETINNFSIPAFEQGVSNAEEKLRLAQEAVAAKSNSRSKTGDWTNKSDPTGQKQQELAAARAAEAQATQELAKATALLTAEENNLSQIEQDIETAEKDIAKTQEDLANAKEADANATNELNKSSEQYSEKVNDAVQATNDLVQGLENVDAHSKNVKAAVDDMTQHFELAQAISNVTNLVGAFGQLASAVNIFSNISNVFKNDSLSDGQKFLQITIALNSALGLGVSAMTKYINVIKKVTGVEKANNTIKTFSLALQKATTDAEKKDVTISFLQAAAKNKVLGAIVKKNLGMTAENAITAINSGTLEANTVATIANQVAKMGLAGIIIAVVIAAIAALTAIILANTKAIKENAKAEAERASADAENTRKIAESKKLEADALTELIDKYEELHQQQIDGKITSEELRLQTYQLCLQYNEQSLAVQALSADYEEMIALMDEAKKKANDTYIEAANYAEDLSEEAIRAQIRKGAIDINTANKNASDITITGLRKNQGFVEELSRAGVKITGDNKINLESLTKAAMDNYDELNRVLNKYVSEKASGTISKILDNARTDIEKYNELQDSNKEIKRQSLFNNNKNNFEKTIATQEDYFEEAGKLAAEAYKQGLFKTFEEAMNWVDAQMSSINEEFADYATSATRAREAFSKSSFYESLDENSVKENLLKNQKLDKSQRDKKASNFQQTESTADNFGEFMAKYVGGSFAAAGAGLATGMAPVAIATLIADAVADGVSGSNGYKKGFDTASAGYEEAVAAKEEYDKSYWAVHSTAAENWKWLPILGSYIEYQQGYGAALSDSIQEYEESAEKAAQEELERREKYNRDFEKEIAKQLDRRSKVEADFISKNFGIILKDWNGEIETLSEAIDEFADKFPTTFKFLEKKSKIFDLDTLLESVDENGFVNTQKVSDYYNENGALKDLDGFNYSYEKFINSGAGTQQRALIAQKIQNTSLLSSAEAEAARTELSNEATRITSEYQNVLDSADEFKKSTDDVSKKLYAASNGAFDFSGEQIFEAYRHTDKEESKKIIEALKTTTDENGESLTSIISDAFAKSHFSADEYNKASEMLDEINGSIESITSAAEDWNNINAKTIELFDFLNEKIDDVQASYKTLSSIEDEFSQEGFLSLDSIQSLLSLSPAYLQYLDTSTEKITFNKEAYLEQAKAMLASQVATFENIYASTMAEIATGEATDETWAKVLATKAEETALWDEADAAHALMEAQYEAARAELITKLGALEAGAAHSAERVEIERKIDALERYKKAADEGYNAGKRSYDNYKLPNLDKIMNSSSKSSSKKNKDKKDWDDEFDRYYVLKKAIEDVEDAMSDLDKLQKHLHGKQLLEALDKQNKLLAEQKKRYQDLVAEQQKEGAELRANLRTFEGMTFADDGNITNYAQVTTEQLNKYNAAVDQYNAGSITEEAFTQIEKEYNAFKKDLTRYEALLKEFKDANNKLDDIYYNELANNLKAWETKIQLKLDLTKAERDWAEFLKNLDTNVKLRFTDINSNLKLNSFNMEQLGLDKETLEIAMNETMDEIYKFVEDKNYKSDKFASLSEAQEELKKYKDSWVSTVNEIRKNWEDAYKDYLQGIDDEAEKLEDIVTQYERLSAQIEHISRMNELLYGVNNFEVNDGLYSAQTGIQLQQMADFRAAADMWNEYYLKAVEEGDEQAAQKFQENYRNAIDNLYATEEEYITTLLNKYENRVKEIFNNLDKQLSGGSSLSWLSEQWDAEKKAAEGYYDTVERVYELETMESKWESALNKTSSLKAQQKMKALMDEELASLEGRTKLNEYDIGLAEKRLAIAEAQAALEDAQNNKNTMKLTRGADGNWSYQYVADDGDIADKQQALLDAQHEAYEYAKENWMQIQETIMDVQKEALEKLQELELAKASATEEEKALLDEQIAYYKDYYENILTTLYEESNKREINLKTETAALTLGLYNADKDNYEKMTNAEKLLIDELLNHSLNDLTDIYTASGDTMNMIQDDANKVLLTDNDSISALWDSAAANMTRRWYSDPDSVKNMFQMAVDNCKAAQNDLDEAIYEGTLAAGEDYTELGEQIDEVAEKTEELAYITEDAFEDASRAIDSYREYVNQLEIAYNNLTTGVYGYVESIKEALRQNQELADRSIANYNAIAEAARNAGIAVASSSGSGPSSTPKQEQMYYVVDHQGNRISEALTKEQADAKLAKINPDPSKRDATGNHFSAIEVEKFGIGATRMPSSSGNSNPNASALASGVYLAVDAKTGKVLYQGDSRSEASKAALTYGTDKAVSVPSNYLYEKDGEIYVRNDKVIFNNDKQRTSDLLLKFDTGGYTGSWNDGSGKLAMLHSKELVLNADDTRNMLETVSAVRSLASIGSSISNSIANSIANMIMGLSSTPALAGAGNSSTDNSVNNFAITMNVDGGDVQAIQEAILSLPNLASQYLSKNLK